MALRIKAIIRKGRIEPLEHLNIPEGTEVFVVPVTGRDLFWTDASESAINSVWGGPEDDVYARLLEG